MAHSTDPRSLGDTLVTQTRPSEKVRGNNIFYTLYLFLHFTSLSPIFKLLLIFYSDIENYFFLLVFSDEKGKTEITDIWINTKDNPSPELYKSQSINMKYETSYNTS